MSSKGQKNEKWFDKFWPFAEPVLAAIVGLVSLLPPLNRPDVAVIVWAVGALFTVSSISTRKQIVAELKRVFEGDFDEVRDASRILSLYSRIQDDDLIQLKSEALTRCLMELENLSRGFAPDIRGTSFYMWFIDQFSKAERSISSISSMPETYWVEYELERKSLRANYDAAKRGCDAKRIFVVQDKNVLRRKHARQVFFEHLDNGVKPLVALPEQVNDAALWEVVKDGFVIIDDRVLLIDTSPPPNTAGRMSKDPSDIAGYRKAFEQLELTSIPAVNFLQDFLGGELAKFESQYGSVQLLEEGCAKAEGRELQDMRSTLDIWKDMIADLERLKSYFAK